MKTIKNIKRSILYLLISTTSILLSCEKEDPINNNGFSEEIKNFVPDSTIQKMRDLGMVINEGKTPPKLEGIFLASPNIMKSSSVPNEKHKIGDKFINYDYEFFNQDNKKLHISVNSKGYNLDGDITSESKGDGAFISGNKNSFTVFVILDGYVLVNKSDTAYYQSLKVISGTITPEGIESFHSALWMLNDYNDPYDKFIPNNSGRVFYDSDSLAIRTSKLKSANLLKKIENEIRNDSFTD